jgi:hypothetical protein
MGYNVGRHAPDANRGGGKPCEGPVGELRQSAISAWNDYCASGLHATLYEADVWLAKLEAGEEVEPPECHA